MIQKDVRVGTNTVYRTRVGSVRVLVLVTNERRSRHGLTFECKRVDNSKILPKWRRASALHRTGLKLPE